MGQAFVAASSASRARLLRVIGLWPLGVLAAPFLTVTALSTTVMRPMSLPSSPPQANCPLAGGELDSGTAITVKGAKIAFCCNNCKGKAEKAEGDAQLDMLFGEKAFGKAGFKVAEKK